MKVSPLSRPCSSAKAAASSTVSPVRITSAPCRRGVHHLHGRRVHGHDDGGGDRQPVGVIGHALGVVAGRHGDHAALASPRRTGAERRLSAPRSLNEAVNCWFSNLSQSLQPRMPESVRLQSQSVSTSAPASRPARRLDVVERDRRRLPRSAADVTALRAAMIISRASRANLGEPGLACRGHSCRPAIAHPAQTCQARRRTLNISLERPARI